MTTFYDPATIRRLAEHDPFYRGAAWILDQQAAANDPVSREIWHRAQVKYPIARRENWDDDWSPVPRTAA